MILGRFRRGPSSGFVQFLSLLSALGLVNAARATAIGLTPTEWAASSSTAGSTPAAASRVPSSLDQARSGWQGAPGLTEWWWQARFDPPVELGAIGQVNGDHPFVLHNAARTYVWQCGDYSGCVFERGPHAVKQWICDPVFSGLPEEFTVMESHCGQIEWPPKGWELIATAGAGAKTRTQCLRLREHCIYAAQFHIEMNGTPDTSRRIMGNFLALAKQWQISHPSPR